MSYKGPMMPMADFTAAVEVAFGALVETRAGLLREAGEITAEPLEVTAAEAVADVRKRIGRFRSDIEKGALAARKPFQALAQHIRDREVAFLEVLGQEDRRLGTLLASFERRRKEELRRQEEERRRKEEEAAAELRALAEQQARELAEVSARSAADAAAVKAQHEEQRREAERLARAEVGAAPTLEVVRGARLSSAPVARIVDPDQVPAAYRVPDIKLIEAKVKALWKALDGDEVRFIAACRQALPGVEVTVEARAGRA